MGLFAAALDKICEQCSTQSIYMLAGLGFATVIVLSVVINVLAQLLFKNPNEPPVVFHWFPFIGNTISYGIDPYKFFFECRRKVGQSSWNIELNPDRLANSLAMHSTATSSRSSYSAKRPQSSWEPKATTLS